MTVLDYIEETDIVDNTLYADFLDIPEEPKPDIYYVGNNAYYNNMNADEPYSNHTMSTYLEGESI